MICHSEHYTWADNWEYLQRCFPSIEKAPDPAKDQFNQRCSKLKQNVLRDAITLAVTKHGKRSITLAQLLEFYKQVLPDELTVATPTRSNFIMDYWVFPRCYSDNVKVYKSEQEARRASADLPGSRVQARWCRPGELGGFQDLDEDPTLATLEQRTETICLLYALIAKSITNRQSTYDYTYKVLSAVPPSHSPPEGTTRASDASASRSGADATSRTPDEGACQAPPYGQNKIDGMTLPRHPLPDHLIEQIERAAGWLSVDIHDERQFPHDDLGSNDTAPPLEAGIACVEPEGGEE